LKNCASEVREARKKGRRGNKRPVTDDGTGKGKIARGNLPVMRNTTFMVVLRRKYNANNDLTFSMQLQSLYAEVRHWAELTDIIEISCSPKEQYSLTAVYKCNLILEELDEKYLGPYTPGPMMNRPLYSQISYNISLCNVFKSKLGHDVTLFLVEMKAATGKDIAKYVIKPARVIPATQVTLSYTTLLI
jgi:hypothetical protein